MQMKVVSSISLRWRSSRSVQCGNGRDSLPSVLFLPGYTVAFDSRGVFLSVSLYEYRELWDATMKKNSLEHLTSARFAALAQASITGGTAIVQWRVDINLSSVTLILR